MAPAFLFAAVAALVVPAGAFWGPASPRQTWASSKRAAVGTSWNDLGAALPATEKPAPVLTLYRDTNGWCPFCERVQVALHAKGVAFEEVLINLQDKPKWYLDMVPTALVPAIKFHDDDTIVYESLKILEALDERFSAAPQLTEESPEMKAAIERNDALLGAGFKFTYGNRNASLSDAERAGLKDSFVSLLKKLDKSLAKKGPFIMGDQVSAADITLIPMLERFRYQLVVTADFHCYDEKAFPALSRWYDAVDALPEYKDRISGDQVSWTLVTSTFLRLFGSRAQDQPNENLEQLVEEADQAAKSALDAVAAEAATMENLAAEPGVRPAAAKLIQNHAAVVADATAGDKEPKSQPTLQRLQPSEAPVVDQVLRNAAARLLGLPPTPVDPAQSEHAAKAARFVASRVSAPRDMGAHAARALRMALFQEERAALGAEAA